VAGEQARLVWQREYLLPDAAHQGFEIASGQIRSSDAALEDNIAAKEQILRLTIEHDVSAGVSWRVPDFEPVRSQMEYLAVSQVYGRLRTGIDAHSEERRSSLHSPQGVIFRMQRHRRRRAAQVGDLGAPCQMIEVSMSQPDISDPPSSRLSLGDDHLSLISGIDHCSLAS
jgi:hypothetical protein